MTDIYKYVDIQFKRAGLKGYSHKTDEDSLALLDEGQIFKFLFGELDNRINNLV